MHVSDIIYAFCFLQICSSAGFADWIGKSIVALVHNLFWIHFAHRKFPRSSNIFAEKTPPLRWDAAPKVESKNCGRTMGGAKKECDPRCGRKELPVNHPGYLFGKSNNLTHGVMVVLKPLFAETINLL